ncbi:protocadherin-10-like [Mustelus asterias]
MEYYNIYCLLKWQLLYCIISSWELVSGQIRYAITEERNLGAFVGNIAEDLGLDQKELSARGFQIVPGPSKQYLDVNADDGILFVKEKIDREQLCGKSHTCTLSLEAVIEKPLNVYHFQVEILDVNDNAPRFPESQFRLEISEVAAPGTRFALECAHDPDVGTNSVQSYQLAANDYFSLDVETRGGDGKLPVLVLERALDREQENTHRIATGRLCGEYRRRFGFGCKRALGSQLSHCVWTQEAVSGCKFGQWDIVRERKDRQRAALWAESHLHIVLGGRDRKPLERVSFSSGDSGCK